MWSKKKTILGLIIISVIAVGVFVIYSINENNYSGGGVIVQEGVITGYTESEIEEMLQKKADESSFSFEINSRPIFENGKSEGNLRVANPMYNSYDLQVEIILKDTKKSIFKSPVLKPNQYIEKAKLKKNLKKGEYEAEAIIKAYKDDEEIGKTYGKIIISVKN